MLITSTGEAPGTNLFEISGDRGHLACGDGKLRLRRNRVGAEEFLKTSKAMFAQPEVWHCEVPYSQPADSNTHRAITNAWVQAILEDTPLVAEGAEGIRSLELSNAMYLSAWTGKTVDLPIDEDLFYSMLQERIAKSTIQKKASAKTGDVGGSFNQPI